MPETGEMNAEDIARIDRQLFKPVVRWHFYADRGAWAWHNADARCAGVITGIPYEEGLADAIRAYERD